MGGIFTSKYFRSGCTCCLHVFGNGDSQGPSPHGYTACTDRQHWVVSPFAGVRPQLASFLFLAILNFELSRFKTTRIFHPWFYPLLFIIWANTHGGFILGFLLLGSFIAGEALNIFTKSGSPLTWKELRKTSFWTISAVLVTLINPNGINLWKLPFYTVQVSFSNINEWASPDFHRIDLQPMLWLIFLLIIGMGFAKKHLDWSGIIKFIGFAYMAFMSQRSIGPFLVIAVPVVSTYLEDLWNMSTSLFQGSKAGYQRQSPGIKSRTAAMINTIILAFLVAIGVGRAFFLTRPALIHADFPYQAVTWMQENRPNGLMFNSYNWGGYLIWTLPEYPVFIDGRADLYGDGLLSDWWKVVNATDAGLKLLEKWNIRLVFVEKGWPIQQKLPAMGWQILYQDSQAVILGR